MSEPTDHSDDLPRTDDPFELLGVDEESADERALKRAYVALIKRYRPDRVPEEFMRIRRAYEDALAQVRWLADHDDDEHQLDHRSIERSVGPDLEWSREVRGYLDDERDSDALDRLARAVAAGEDGAAETVLEWLEDDLLARLVTRPELAWENLARQSNRWAALTLLSRRFDQMVLQNDARVLGELDTLEFRRALLGEPMLESIALGVLVRAAWEGDHRVPRLFGMLSDPTAGQASFRHYRVEEAMDLSESWQAFISTWRVPPSLVRVFMMFESVATAGKAQLLRELEEDLDRDWRGFLRCLDALTLFDRRLVEYFFEAVDELTYDDEERLEELREETEDIIAERMRQADGELRRGTGQKRTWAAAAAGAAACCLLFPSSVGLAAATGVLLTVGFWQFLPDYEGYHRNARPIIAQIVVETGVSPEHLLDWIGKNSRVWNRLRLEASYDGDLALKLFGDLARLSIAWARPERPVT